MKVELKGYLYAFLSVLAISNVYIFSKAALNEINIFQFGVLWFGFGLIWILIYAKYRDCYRIIRELLVSQFFKLTQMGLFEVFGTYFFYKAINTISSPSTVSFLGNISPIILILLGFIFLKERFSKLDVLGMILSLFGAVIISTKGAFNFTLFIDGVQYILFSSLIFGVNGILIKKNISALPPIVITINRSFFLFVFSLAAFLYTGQSLDIPNSAILNTFIGSILGPFLAIVLVFFALKYIPVSKKAVISSTKGVFVVIGAYLYFDEIPDFVTVIGGAISIVGVVIISFGAENKPKQLEVKRSVAKFAER